MSFQSFDTTLESRPIRDIAYEQLKHAIITGQIPEIGSMLCPMHIPALLCGFMCGWPWGLAVGVIAPLMRSVIFQMPPMFPTAAAMACELAAYGFLSGLLYKKFPKGVGYIYLTLGIAMVGGRLVWGAARYVFAGIQGTGFTFSAFLAGAVTGSIPGIVLHIVLIPLIVLALRKAKLVLNE